MSSGAVGSYRYNAVSSSRACGRALPAIRIQNAAATASFTIDLLRMESLLIACTIPKKCTDGSGHREWDCVRFCHGVESASRIAASRTRAVRLPRPGAITNLKLNRMPENILQSTGQMPLPLELIERRIYVIRGQKVMLDADLAELYQAPTKNLNLAVRRNTERFPEDFMFQLTAEEAESLRLQSATSKLGRGGRRYLPYAFTEHGVAMLSSVLNSQRAVQMSILIIRALVKLRELLASHRNLAARVEKLEASHNRHASVINLLAEEIEDLKRPPAEPARRRIGFRLAGS